MKRKEREFEFIVVETVTYRLRAKGATVEKAAERAGQMFAQGPWRYFEAVEDRAVRCDWPGKAIPKPWVLRPSSAAVWNGRGDKPGGDVSQSCALLSVKPVC